MFDCVDLVMPKMEKCFFVCLKDVVNKLMFVKNFLKELNKNCKTMQKEIETINQILQNQKYTFEYVINSVQR